MKLALINITKDFQIPPLNLVYLATYIKNHFQNIQIRIVDINFEDPLKTILKIRPDIIGISSISVRYNYAKSLAYKIKKSLDVPIVIGGVHISTCPESFEKCFDIGVIGEGEKTLLELLRIFKKGYFSNKTLKKVKGIIFHEDNKLIRTKDRELIENLDDIPIPDRNFLNKAYFSPRDCYYRLTDEKVIETGILTTRGCPYKCVFCSTSTFWKKVRFHSVDYIAAEIEYLTKEFGVNSIMISDDIFPVSEEIVKSLYEKLKGKKIIGKVIFSCQLRANMITDNLCKLLRKLGVKNVNFGFESGSERVLSYLKSNSVTVEQNKRAVVLCKKYGFSVRGSFMIASPRETIKDMRKTLELMDFMINQGVSGLWCGVTKPYPETELWKYGIKNNLFDKNLNLELIDPSYIHNPIFLNKNIPRKEFFRIFREAKYKSFMIEKEKIGTSRKFKDFFYYNKFFYDSANKMLNFLPQGMKKVIVSLFGIKGLVSTT